MEMKAAGNRVSLQPIRTRLNPDSARSMLAAWSGDLDVMAAQATVSTEITAVELVERITKLKRL